MKKIIKLLFLIILVTLYAGCTPDEEDIFAESSASRIEAVLKKDKALLCAPKNGWIMEYYPSSTQEYGGYTMWLSFSTDGKVKVANEFYGADSKVTSLYSLKQSAGPVLTFDTYNEVMHFFSTPDNPIGIGDAGDGMEGDFEFTILSAEADKIVLKGKKSGSTIIMNALADNESGEDYISSVISAETFMRSAFYKYEVNGKTIQVTTSYRNLTFTYEKDGAEVSISAPYLVTPTGYKFYSPLEIEGVTVDELKYQKIGEEESFIPTNGAAAKLVIDIHPINQHLISNDWYFAYSGLGALTQMYWDYTKENGLDAINERLYYAYLGAFKNGQFGFCFGSYDGSSIWTGLLSYDYTLIDENQITLSFALAAAGEGSWYYSKAKFSYLITPIGTDEGTTFTLATDNVKMPTWIKLTDNTNPNNTMKLYNTSVYWPYDN